MMGHDGICPICMLMYMYHIYIQLFRERLSEKVQATIPKGIVGGFVCPVLRRNLKEWQRKATKVGSTATVVRNGVLIISHITFRGCRVHILPDNLSRNSCIPDVYWYKEHTIYLNSGSFLASSLF